MTKITLGTLAVAFVAVNVLGLDCGTFCSILLTAAFAAASYGLGSLLGRKE
jgi:hypothetical protein